MDMGKLACDHLAESGQNLPQGLVLGNLISHLRPPCHGFGDLVYYVCSLGRRDLRGGGLSDWGRRRGLTMAYDDTVELAEEILLRQIAEENGLYDRPVLTGEQEASLAQAVSLIRAIAKETDSTMSQLLNLAGVEAA